MNELIGIYPFNLLNAILDDCYDVNLRVFLNLLSEKISVREKEVLECRFKHLMTLEETGKRFGVTRERIRQVESKGIRKLRRELTKNDGSVSLEEFKQLNLRFGRLLTILKKQQIIGSALEFDDELIFKEMSIEYLGLNVRSYNCLKRAGINTIDDLLAIDKEQLKQVRNLGRYSYNEIIERLNDFGYDYSTKE